MKNRKFLSILLSFLIGISSFFLVKIPSNAFHQSGIDNSFNYPQIPADGGTFWRIRKHFRFPNSYVSSSFTEDQYLVIRDALEGAMFAVNDKRFAVCSAQNSNPSIKENKLSGGFLGLYPLVDRVKIHLTKLNVGGRIYVERVLPKEELVIAEAYLEHKNRFGFFRISLNPDYVKDNDNDKALLYGAIVHEMLHNLGHDHSAFTNTKKAADATGNFTYETGWCVSRFFKQKVPGKFGLVGNGRPNSQGEHHVD